MLRRGRWTGLFPSRAGREVEKAAEHGRDLDLTCLCEKSRGQKLECLYKSLGRPKLDKLTYLEELRIDADLGNHVVEPPFQDIHLLERSVMMV